MHSHSRVVIEGGVYAQPSAANLNRNTVNFLLDKLDSHILNAPPRLGRPAPGSDLPWTPNRFKRGQEANRLAFERTVRSTAFVSPPPSSILTDSSPNDQMSTTSTKTTTTLPTPPSASAVDAFTQLLIDTPTKTTAEEAPVYHIGGKMTTSSSSTKTTHFHRPGVSRPTPVAPRAQPPTPNGGEVRGGRFYPKYAVPSSSRESAIDSLNQTRAQQLKSPTEFPRNISPSVSSASSNQHASGSSTAEPIGGSSSVPKSSHSLECDVDGKCKNLNFDQLVHNSRQAYEDYIAEQNKHANAVKAAISETVAKIVGAVQNLDHPSTSSDSGVSVRQSISTASGAAGGSPIASDEARNDNPALNRGDPYSCDKGKVRATSCGPQYDHPAPAFSPKTFTCDTVWKQPAPRSPRLSQNVSLTQYMVHPDRPKHMIQDDTKPGHLGQLILIAENPFGFDQNCDHCAVAGQSLALSPFLNPPENLHFFKSSYGEVRKALWPTHLCMYHSYFVLTGFYLMEFEKCELDKWEYLGKKLPEFGSDEFLQRMSDRLDYFQFYCGSTEDTVEEGSNLHERVARLDAIGCHRVGLKGGRGADNNAAGA